MTISTVQNDVQPKQATLSLPRVQIKPKGADLLSEP